MPPGLQLSGGLGGVDHPDRDPVLHRAAGVEVLDLGEHERRGGADRAVELDQRGVADQLEEGIGVLHAANLPAGEPSERALSTADWQAPTRLDVASFFTSAPRDPEIGAYFPRFHYTTVREFQGRHAEMTATRPKTSAPRPGRPAEPRRPPDARPGPRRRRRRDQGPEVPQGRRRPTCSTRSRAPASVKDLQDLHRQARRHRHQGALRRRRLRLAPRHRPACRTGGKLAATTSGSSATPAVWSPLRLPEPGAGQERPDHAVRPGDRATSASSPGAELPALLRGEPRRPALEPDRRG